MNNTTISEYGGLKQVFAVSLGLFLVFLDSTVVNIALPTIMNDFKIDLNVASWIINSFVLTLAILLITVGKLADIFGRIRLFLVGVLIFAISSFLCGVAPSVEVLIASRVLQGIAGAMIIPTSMMLVRTAVPQEKTGLAMGIWGAIGALAVAIGPSIGGVVTEYIDWRWIFYINVPIIIVSFPFLLWVFKGRKDVKAPLKLDIWGVLFISVALYFFTYAILQGEKLGWNSTIIYGYFCISLIAGLLFFIIESQVKFPLVDFSIFKNKEYLGGVISNFFGGLIMMGILILLPIYFTQVKGYSTLQASFLITPLSAVMLVVAPIIGRVMDKIGYQIPMFFGYLFTIASFIPLLKLSANTEISTLILIMSLLGTGLGILMVTSVTVCTATVSDEHMSLGSGIFATARNMGGALGVSIFVSITMSFLNQFSVEIVDDGISQFEKASLPTEVRAAAIEKLEVRRESFFEGGGELERFEISKEIYERVTLLQKQEVLKQLPPGASITPAIEEQIRLKINTEMTAFENEINDIQNDLRKDANFYVVKAMSKAFFSGLILACLFSLSLLLLRKRETNANHTSVVSE
ncbi:MFS transporter [Solibacillus sp. FSL H8-0538]|uniref:MFS transporter n=1 Tax=Solibacillus sp. FSL H8-0538 TaxID=2921400 RepID=UPI0030F87FC6